MSTLSRAVSTVRVGSVVVAIGVVAWVVRFLAAMPPPPPDSDGFAHGMAAIIGGGVMLVALGLATVVIVTPSLLGLDDPLGFNRWQRRALQAAAALVGVGVVVALATGLEGLFALLTLLVVGFGVVCATLLWRLAEVVFERRRTRSST